MSDDIDDLGDRLRRIGFRARKDSLAAFLAHAHKSRVGPTETVEQLVDLEERSRAAVNLARRTRFYDRVTDLYITESLGPLVHEAHEVNRVARAKARLESMLTGIDAHLNRRQWIMGDSFTLADCALVPALSNHRGVYPMDKWTHVSAYLERALERPSVARVRREVEAYEARVAS